MDSALRAHRRSSEQDSDTRHVEGGDGPPPLTPREIEIVRLIAKGLSNREISAALGTTCGTVKNQASSILRKLKVTNRTRAGLRAGELGLL